MSRMRSAWLLVFRPHAAALIYDSTILPRTGHGKTREAKLISRSTLPTTIASDSVASARAGPASWRAGKRPVAIMPLALVLALHLALALLWANTANRSTEQGASQRYFTLMWLRAPAPRDPPPAPPARRTPATRVAAPVPAPAAPQTAPSPVAQPFDNDLAQDSALPVPDAAETRGVTRLMDMAKRQAGAIDHALRDGELAPLAPDRDLPITRLRGALESAYIDRSRTTVSESMTQADGVVVYRFRRGNKVWCRQSGGVGSSIERSDGAKLAGAGSAGGAGTAGTVTCPSGEAGWARL